MVLRTLRKLQEDEITSQTRAGKGLVRRPPRIIFFLGNVSSCPALPNFEALLSIDFGMSS